MIVDEIVRYIDENKISRTYLIEEAGMSEQLILGEERMSIEEYLRVCTALNVSYEYFFDARKDRAKKEFDFAKDEKMEE